MKTKSASAFAPATIGNVGVGFDLLGVALNAIGDVVTVTETKETGRIEIVEVSGVEVPTDPVQNTATAGMIHLLRDRGLDLGFKVKIKKGIPLGSGMGGSAASAVAGAVAVNSLLKKPLSKSELLKYALIGESVATGSVHGDNVAPCLFGGLILIQPKTDGDFKTISIPFPKGLVIVLALPNARLDTREARKILKQSVSLQDFVRQSAYLTGFVAGCFQNDLNLIESSLKDVVIEPQRARLIKGFYEVQAAALSAGAMGCTISGAGPAIFALTKKSKASKVKSVMLAAFDAAGVGPARGWISPVNKEGAYVL